MFATPFHKSFAMSTLRPRNQACGTAFRAFSCGVWAGRPACGPHRARRPRPAARGSPAARPRPASPCARAACVRPPGGRPRSPAADPPGDGAASSSGPSPRPPAGAAGPPTGTGGPRCARACGGGSGAVPVRSRGSGGRPPGRSASRRCATAARRPSRRCGRAGRGRRDGPPRCPHRDARPLLLGAGQHALPAGGADGRRLARVEDAPPSATLPARTLERRTKPLASSVRPSVSGGQSWRFSLEWPRRARGCRSTAPSQQVLVRSWRVTVGCRSNRPMARCGPDRPSCSSRGGRRSCRMAHTATCSTPACTSWAALRWASSSTAGEQASSSRDRWGGGGERGCARRGRTAPARPRAAGRSGGRGCAGCAGAPWSRSGRSGRGAG